VILQRNKNSVSVIDVDSVGGSAPAIHIDHAEIIIPEFVKDVKVLYPFVIAISQLYLKAAIVLGHKQYTVFLLVAEAFLFQSLADSAFQVIDVTCVGAVKDAASRDGNTQDTE